MSDKMEVIPNQTKVAKDVFQTQDGLEKFTRDFFSGIEDELQKLDQARRKSEEDAKMICCC